MKPINLLFIFVLIIILASCQEITNIPTRPQLTDSCNFFNYNIEDFNIKIIDYKELPYVNNKTKFGNKMMHDVNGVPIHIYQGRKNYHPVYIAQFGLDVLDVQNNHPSNEHLILLKHIADKLEGISLNIDSSMFYPYNFDFSLHGIKKETMYAPWYSGMSQGQVLSFFVRLYELTKNEKYFNIAKKTFNSFLRMKGEKKTPWVSCVDSIGNLWLEEYPRPIPALTLNGKIFAIYGVYDFYRINPSKNVKNILNGAITTIKNNIKKYRNENDLSWYCQKHDIKNRGYHEVHIKQLSKLGLITGDKYFAEISETFAKDTPALTAK